MVDDILAYRADGRWSASRIGLSVPRQSGKNAVLEIVELFKLTVLGRRILHTAHEVKTARKAFLRLVGFFESRAYPELMAMLAPAGVRRTNGQEAIYLTNGASIEFIARSKGSGRGFTVDDIVMDEAQALDEIAYAALLPTISASPSGNPQQILTGTPPGPADSGEVFTRLRKDALSGKSVRTAWLEWSFAAGADPDDRSQWARANPGLGYRLDPEVIADERAALDDETFIRERGGVWADGSVTRSPIGADVWAELIDPGSKPLTALSLGLDIPPDGTSTTVAIVGRRDDGRWHGELVAQASGTEWVPARVAEIVARNGVGPVVVDGASPALSLVEPLRGAGVEVTVTGSRDMGQACAVLLQVVFGGRFRHLGQPQLATAVDGARKRAIGSEGLWGWGRSNSSADIAPVVALTLALWGAMSSKAAHQPKRRSGRAVFRG